MRTLFMFCVTAFLALPGCASAKPPSNNVKTSCEGETAADGYGCKTGEMCPILLRDVREMPGFRVVSTMSGVNGTNAVHVADGCQHYFCGVDKDCLEDGGYAVTCMHSTGCTLVHKIKK